MTHLDHSEICLDGLSPVDQDELVLVLDQYMIDLEEGRQPDIDELVAKHPHLESALRTYLSGLDLIREAVSTPTHIRDGRERAIIAAR